MSSARLSLRETLMSEAGFANYWPEPRMHSLTQLVESFIHLAVYPANHSGACDALDYGNHDDARFGEYPDP
ncbi:hypothetical protein A9Z42_0028780 [Trichoderma parareesei]|uniref:Uncharacterized protein n=1 Tax=Trichoderma parareesei TaxID=858221 RepID=A0A2H2Z3X1_TRIPA|nr:hypothetical protein A9Z42_0028780 [Trichoderma parareesei]